MKELAQLFLTLGITEKTEIKKALRSYLNEYYWLDKTTNNDFLRIVHIILNDGIFDSPVKRKLAPWHQMNLTLPTLLLEKQITPDSSSFFEKVGQMVIAEGASDFVPVIDYARIAAHVYGNRKDSILPKPWTPVGNRYQGLKLFDEESGLQAALYCKQGNEPEYVYAIAGTRRGNIKDWLANGKQLLGISDQYNRACKIAEKLAEKLGTKRLIMVGHSKGGGQAAYCSLRTGCRAITFNPAGLGPYKYNFKSNVKPDINSYVMVLDPLNLMQMLAQLVKADLTADGSVHYLMPDKDSPAREWHGIDGFLRLGGMKDMHRLTTMG